MAEIVISSLTFGYRNKPIFNDFSLSLQGPGVFLLTGPSGCGKTTLLRLVAGLERPASGTLSVTDPVAFAFQEYRLFPRLSALQNVTCVRSPKTKEDASANVAEARDLLFALGLSPDDADATPDALSGGMKQRVSLARALFSPHPIKLLDEVTKELDPATVALVLEQIRLAGKKALILFSTHHPEDLSDFATKTVELSAHN